MADIRHFLKRLLDGTVHVAFRGDLLLIDLIIDELHDLRCVQMTTLQEVPARLNLIQREAVL